ncbi:hypothetical protein NPIL_647821 [Nephila pilipes]|uniref:Uncharacterized protein n=1 Tax=Nephila pilipes TaxID=299642 RepID=A0A8X6PKB9_NEPPI|nr:hypothetical protein NPIL_647821 [Nephila pilipes]
MATYTSNVQLRPEHVHFGRDMGRQVAIGEHPGTLQSMLADVRRELSGVILRSAWTYHEVTARLVYGGCQCLNKSGTQLKIVPMPLRSARGSIPTPSQTETLVFLTQRQPS